MQDLVNCLESWLKDRKIDILSGKKVNALHIFNLLNSKNGTRIIDCLVTTHMDAAEHIPSVFDPTVLKSRGLTCLTCGFTFEDLMSQQQHFKTSAHRQNLIRKLHGLAPQHTTGDEIVDADMLAKRFTSSALVDEPPSDEEDGDSNSDKDDELEAPTGQTIADNSKFSNEFGTVRKSFSRTYGPLLHFRFRSSTVGESSSTSASASSSSLLRLEFCIPTAICRQDSGLNRIQFFESGINPFALLRAHLQQLRHNCMVTVLMLRSGRFAGAVFDYDASKGCSHMLVHKVFRRYTVRAKAGGGQASHDNKGGKARSAGAMLRRYGEQALKDDVASTLQLWSGHIESSGAILIAVPRTMRPSLFESAASVLDKDDTRIAYVPFPVDKPTLESVQLIHGRCTSILFTSVVEKAVPNFEMQENTHVGLDGDDSKESEAMESVAIESSDVVEHSDVFQVEEEDLLMDSPVSKSLIVACMAENEVEVLRILNDPAHNPEDLQIALTIPDSLVEMNTPLHIASAKGLLKAVYALLVKGASPCQLDVRGRPAYFLAKDKDTRDVFRRFRGAVEEQEEEAEADLGELADGETSSKKLYLCNWDWTAAGVGPALTESIEKNQRQKEKEKKKRAAQRKKEQKIQDERAAAAAALQLAQQQKDDEERKEKQKMDAGKCAACGQLLFGLIPIQLLGEKCCSSACALKVRRSLAAEAALKRLDRMS